MHWIVSCTLVRKRKGQIENFINYPANCCDSYATWKPFSHMGALACLFYPCHNNGPKGSEKAQSLYQDVFQILPSRFFCDTRAIWKLFSHRCTLRWPFLPSDHHKRPPKRVKGSCRWHIAETTKPDWIYQYPIKAIPHDWLPYSVWCGMGNTWKMVSKIVSCISKYIAMWS